jgi:hypothetical protein
MYDINFLSYKVYSAINTFTPLKNTFFVDIPSIHQLQKYFLYQFSISDCYYFNYIRKFTRNPENNMKLVQNLALRCFLLNIQLCIEFSFASSDL